MPKELPEAAQCLSAPDYQGLLWVQSYGTNATYVKFYFVKIMVKSTTSTKKNAMMMIMRLETLLW